MSLLRHCILPITLGLFLAPASWAGDDDKKSGDKKGDEQTIKGVVSEVTLIGETDVDIQTGKAITADSVFVTIIGHPWNPDAKQWDHEKGREHASNDKDREVKRTSTVEKSAGSRKHRMNVYVVAITPKTKVCECMTSGKEGSAAKEAKCDLDKLEIGDRVEVCFSSKESDKDAKEKTELQKHGRHRTYFGVANDLKILDEPMEGERSASTESKDKK